MTYVQLAPVWTAVVLFWRWVRLTSGVQCVLQRGGGASGGGASGRIHDKDTEEFSEAEHKESFYIFYQ